jgi:hypothetical protein
MCRVERLGFEVQGLRSRALGLRVSGFPGLRVKIQGSRFKVQGSGFRVQGLGFRVPGLGFRVPGLGFKA